MAFGLLDTPALGDSIYTLHQYQQDAVDAIRGEFERGIRRTACVAATGTGKGTIIGAISRKTVEKNRRVLLLSHTKDLVNQLANTLDDFGIQPAIEMAGQHARALFEPMAVSGSVATLCRPDRLATWPRDYFSLIIPDEAHHVPAEIYLRILRYFNKARVVGFTATYMRNDDEDLNEIFQSIAYQLDLWTAISKGYLADLDIRPRDIGLNLKGLVPKKGGDFSEDDLEKRIQPIVETGVNLIRQEIDDRKGVIFTPRVASAQAFATGLQSLGHAIGWEPGMRADWISGDDPDRAKKLLRFKAGQIRILCNAQLLTEGVDVKDIAFVGMFRPTNSLISQSQMLGRGLRLAEGKTDCRAVDPCGFEWGQNLANPLRLCAGSDVDSEVLDCATEIMLRNKGMKLTDAIAAGKKKHRELQILRIEAKFRELRYRKISYRPLEICDVVGIPWSGRKVVDVTTDHATPAQVKLLEGFGVEGCERMSKTRARTMIDYMMARKKQSLATPRQLAWLLREGVEPERARAMTSREASEFLDSRWGGKKKRGA